MCVSCAVLGFVGSPVLTLANLCFGAPVAELLLDVARRYAPAAFAVEIQWQFETGEASRVVSLTVARPLKNQQDICSDALPYGHHADTRNLDPPRRWW